MHGLVPKSHYGKAAAALWACACFGVLAFGFLQRSVHDMPVAFTWFMIILSFPAGIIGVLIAGVGWPALLYGLGYSYQPFRDEIPIWVLAFVSGYWQWFVLLPRVASWLASRRQRSEA